MALAIAKASITVLLPAYEILRSYKVLEGLIQTYLQSLFTASSCKVTIQRELILFS